MRYEYKINNDSIIKANSFKKLLELLPGKFKPGEVVKVSYLNKKKNQLLKFIKVKKSDWHLSYVYGIDLLIN